jgi:hypothetical protein
VQFNWSSNDTISGISAYSFVLDADQSTRPDEVPELETEHVTLRSSKNDGNETVLKYNHTGAASAVFVEVKSNMSAGDVLRITMLLAESHVDTSQEMGLSVYATDTAAGSLSFNQMSNNISTIVNITKDLTYKASLLDALSYTAEIALSANVSDGSFFVAVSGDLLDDDNTYNILLATSNTTAPGAQSYYCVEGGGCTNTSSAIDYGIRVEKHDLALDGVWDKSYTVADGTFYFHVRALDVAGNWGPTTTYTINVDTSGPSTPQMTEPVKTSNSTSLTFNWSESTDVESGVDNYYLQVSNSSDFATTVFSAFVGNVTNKTVSVTEDQTYYARVKARNLAGVNSSYSSLVTTTVDTIAPSITFSKPTGTIVSTDATIVARTNEKAVCTYSLNTAPYKNFTFTNSTYHETKITATTGSNTATVKCTDAVNNENTTSLSFTVDTSATPGSSGVTVPSVSGFTDSVLRFDVLVKTAAGTGLGEYKKDDFAFELRGNAYPFSVADNGDGNYSFMIDTPLNNGTYSMKVTVAGVSGESTLVVTRLLFTVSYLDAGLSPTTKPRMTYYLAGNYSIGVATDSKTPSTAGSTNAINVSADAITGDIFVFVSRPSGDVERVESLLRDQTFLDTVNPSFGYKIDQETFIIYTNLEYDDIALSGNQTLETGRHTLIIENKGFDSTLNKTKLEVRLK